MSSSITVDRTNSRRRWECVYGDMCRVQNGNLRVSCTGQKANRPSRSRTLCVVGAARYMTVLTLRCKCGERTERRYENRAVGQVADGPPSAMTRRNF